MKKFLMVLVVFLSSILFVKNVKGENVSDYMLKKYNIVPDTYIAQISSEKKRYDYFYVIARKSDKKYVYCIEPGKSINENNLYTGFTSNLSSVSGMTDDELEEIKKYVYYGYGYSNHLGLSWYAATQYLIWQVKKYGFDIYYTDGLQGNRITKFDKEMYEIKTLSSNHNLKPNLLDTYKVFLGEKITLTDSNSILNVFDVESYDDNINVTKDGNNLIVEGIKDGSAQIVLKRKFNYYKTKPIVYSNYDSQKIISSGDLDDIVFKININVVGGKLIVDKHDKEVGGKKTQGNAVLGGAIYDVYDENNNFLISLTTDMNGYAESDNIFKIGPVYTMKEHSASKGYLLDEEVFKFTFTKNDLVTRIHSYEPVIKAKVTLNKVYENKNSGVMKGEPYVSFSIYNEFTGELYRKISTNKDGILNITLPYGYWIFKQNNSTSSYEIAPPFLVEVLNTQDINKVVSNKLISTKLKLINLDMDTNDVINNKSFKFKIKNLDTGKYVCQNVTYPNEKEICDFKTNDGYFITPNSLMLGNYQIEQIDSNVEGYLWNKNVLKFSINDNSNYIRDGLYGNIFEVKFYNKQVKGKVNLFKYGELEKINNGIYYEKTFLDKVGYSLYAGEDIYDALGILKYKKNDLVKKIETINGKYVFTDLYLGKYYLIEDYTNINYKLDNEKYYFELKYKDQYTEIINLDVKRNNYLNKGNLEISKLDYKNNNGIYDTKIELHIESGTNDILVGTYSTDINGKINIFNIPIIYGYKYYVKEVKSSINYVLNSTKIYFDFSKDNHAKLFIYNKKCTGILDLVVVDKDSNEPIKNTLINVINDENEIVYKGYTDSDGRIYKDNLEYGNYRVYEEENVSDYYKDDTIYYFSVNDDNKYVRLILYKYKIKQENINMLNSNNDIMYENKFVDVGNTNKNILYKIVNINYMLIIVLLFILFKEINYVIIDKKRGI